MIDHDKSERLNYHWLSCTVWPGLKGTVDRITTESRQPWRTSEVAARPVFRASLLLRMYFKSNFTRSHCHLAVGDLGSRWGEFKPINPPHWIWPWLQLPYCLSGALRHYVCHVIWSFSVFYCVCCLLAFLAFAFCYLFFAVVTCCIEFYHTWRQSKVFRICCFL